MQRLNKVKTQDQPQKSQVDAYLSELRAQQERTPDFLRQRILDTALSQPTNTDLLTWLSETWWRMATATVGPLAVGLLFGLSTPDITPDASEDPLLFFDYAQIDYTEIANDYYLSGEESLEVAPDE